MECRNVDVYCRAAVELAVAYTATDQLDQAIGVLDKLGPEAPNQAEILAARSFVVKKQYKTAEANAAMMQAKTLDRTIQEIK